MKEKKRLEITLETHELTIVRFQRAQTLDFCVVCRAYTPHLSIAEAVSVTDLSETAVFRLALNGRLHAHENPDGRIALCGNSLARFGDV